MDKQLLVIKIGTALLTNRNGNIDQKAIEKISSEIKQLEKNYNIILVSSGAVGCGKKYIKDYKGSTDERKAAAAIGNPLLMRLYYQQLSKRGIMVSQVLCERNHFSDRKRFVELKNTFEELRRNNILPIINENDIVSNIDLKFSDNDELATLAALGFNAEKLIICTSAGGFMNDKDQIIPQVDKIDKTILSYVRMDKTGMGLGGMVSKLTYTKLAASLGIEVIICGLNGEEPLEKAISGRSGTIFKPKKIRINARNRWLASGAITIGTIKVDKGAEKALKQHKSLLTVGISQIEGKFESNEVVKIENDEDEIIGVAKVKMNVNEINKKLNEKHTMAAHVDDIVLF